MRLLIAMARMTAQYASGAAIFSRLRHAVHSDQPTSRIIASGVFTASVTGKEIPHAEMMPLPENVRRVPFLVVQPDIVQPSGSIRDETAPPRWAVRGAALP
jgi:hypothetical protein